MGKKFKKLERKIEREYEKRGYGKKKSEYIGRATAGMIYRVKLHEKIHDLGKH